MREFKKSKNCFQKAIEIDSKYVGAYINLGNILKELGEYKQAVTNYQKAIQIQPNNLKSYLNLAILFKDQGDVEKATDPSKGMEYRRNFIRRVIIGLFGFLKIG